VERVRHEIRRLDQAVDALLRFMRPEKLRLEPLAINDLLSQAGDRAVQPGIKVEYHLGPSVPMIRADGAVLTEALENLVRNAVEAMPNGGKITISSKAAGPDFLEVSIADQGIGIKPENLERIFNLYFTTKENGSGIGLSLALRAVELHHGSINVDSKPGAGTAIIIRLPALAAIEVEHPEHRVG
jgi:signal transduction histidine kinase